MRRILQLSLACMAAGVVSACSNPDQVTDVPLTPTAGVRFINAVPDTAGSAGLDFRFVDIVENNAHFTIGFRNNISVSGGVPASTQIEYKAAAAGARHFKIFLDDTLTAVAQIALKDSTVTLEANHRYTMLLWATRAAAPPDEAHGHRRDGLGAQVGLRVVTRRARDRCASISPPARYRPRRAGQA